MFNGRHRWKAIKSYARQGPAAAWTAWCFARKHQRQCPELPFIWQARLHDRALAVKLAKPTMPRNTRDGLIARVRREMAEEGDELTPAEVSDSIDKHMAIIRRSLRARGYPMPDDIEAVSELVIFLWQDRDADICATSE